VQNVWVHRIEGTSATVRRPVRGLVIGALWIAALGVPTGLFAPQAVADPYPCGGSINVPVVSIGTPVDPCGAPDVGPVITGGAPSQQTLTDCSGIPGCLSNVLYGPGNVVVPNRDTKVQQSQ
jgi:hypothetical protein